jgi:hypothetical protein
MAMVVEVDGQVRQALWDPYDDAARPPFWLLPGGVGDHTATWSLYAFGAEPPQRAGFGGSDLDLEPKVLFDMEPERGLPRPGKSYFVDRLILVHPSQLEHDVAIRVHEGLVRATGRVVAVRNPINGDFSAVAQGLCLHGALLPGQTRRQVSSPGRHVHAAASVQ